MPCDVSQLERGAICVALYPYTLGFPVEQVLRDAEDELLRSFSDVQDIDQLQATIRPNDPPTELLARFKLRRVLILHDGTKAGIQDVAVARINSVTDKKRSRAGWYAKLDSGNHPTALLIGREPAHGSHGVEGYVDCTSVMSIRKDTILRRVGILDEAEMVGISRRLIIALEIDVQPAHA